MLVGPIKKGTPGGGAKAAPPGPQDDPVPDSQPRVNPNELVIPSATPKTGKVDPKEAKAEALARIQREAALRRAQELQAKAAIPQATPGSNGAEAVPNATNAPGGSGDGTGDGGSEYGVEWSTLTGAATYEQQVQAIVIDSWLPPLSSEKKVIQCVVRVVIGFDGTITSTSIESSSDDAAFDASALAALRKVGKFPPPPIDLKSYLSRKGVPLRFDSRTKKAAGP
jgi:TolA protein